MTTLYPYDSETEEPSAQLFPAPDDGLVAASPAASGWSGQPVQADLVEPAPTVSIRASRPRSDIEVLTVAGDIDTETVDELARCWPHPSPLLRTVVLELTCAERLIRVVGTAGVQLLTHACQHAQQTRVELRIVATDPAILQLMHTSGLEALRTSYPSVRAAMTGPTENLPEPPTPATTQARTGQGIG